MTTEFFKSLGIDPDADSTFGETELPIADGPDPKAAPIASEPVFFDRCPKCGGSGRYGGFTRRSAGRCFKCNGKGQVGFKTSPEARAKSRENAAARKVKTADAWKTANPNEWRWIANRSASFGFAASMSTTIDKYGSLTDGQLAAVQRCIVSDETKAERDAERQAQWAQERAEREAAAPAVSIAAIETAFKTAQGNGIKYPRLRLDTFEFKPATATSKNAGAIYVTERGDYLGKVMDGKFQRVRNCDDATEARIVAVCADPKKAATAYGQRVGACSVCGRELTAKQSVANAIGPICSAKYGWG